MKINAIIMAAGKGTRMKSLDESRSKVAYPILGKPIVRYILDALVPLNCNKIVTVVGFGGDVTSEIVKDKSEIVWQHETLGSGHAVEQTRSILENEDGATIVVCGDTPLITSETLKNLVDLHEKHCNSLTFITAKPSNPHGYGRIIRNEFGDIVEIKEQKDCNEHEDKISEVNAGFYIFDNKMLFESLKQIKPNNAQHEYYLTDMVEILVDCNSRVEAYLIDDANEMLGINDRVQLAEATKLIKNRVNRKLMLSGVGIEDPDNTYISPDVEIGRDTIIGHNTTILGHSVIGEGNNIGPNNYLVNVEIGNNNSIISSFLTETRIGNDNEIGPFTKTRANTWIEDNCRIGNFVELKNAHYHNGVKTAHLTYIGDAEVGERTNIGCMTVTANYDGYNKSRTSIGKDVFIGSGTIIVAPLTVEDESFTAAGSVIVQNVAKDEMAIARARQVNKPHLRTVFLMKAKAKKEAGKK